MIAIQENTSVETVTTLLELGARVSDRAEFGITPLMLAAGWNPNACEIVEVLLDCDADATAKDKEGSMAVDYAKNNPALADTETFWRLNNLSYD